MKKEQKLSRSPAKLIILYALITAFVLIIGIRYYFKQKGEVRKEKYSELSVIADLKINQIINWRKERIGDATSITQSKIFTSALKKWFVNPGDVNLNTAIISHISAFFNYYQYGNIFIFDTNFRIRIALDKKEEYLNKIISPDDRKSFDKKNTNFTKIYFDKPEEICLDVVSPLFDGEKFLGGVIIRIYPVRYLFPLIQSWPTASESSETLLITKQDDEVVYVNELRHKKNTALKLKFKIDSSNLNIPAVMAAMGKIGFVEGFDYRGIAVLSDIQKISDSPWYIITKVDLDEIYAPLYEKTVNLSIIVGLILISIGIGFVWTWTNQKKSIRIQHLEEERKLQALIKHFDYIVKYANDIFILTDKNLNIVEVNDRAVQTYGYSRDELIRLNIMDLRTADSARNLNEQLRILNVSNEAFFETVHKRKDGTTFHVDVSTRTVNIEGAIYYQIILKDITERMQALEELKESESRFRKLFDKTPLPLCYVDKDGIISFRNDRFIEVFGYTVDDVLTSTDWWNKAYPDPKYRQWVIKTWDIVVRRAVEEGQDIDPVEYKITCKNGEVRIVEISGITLGDEILVTFTDLTEKKKADELLRESETLYGNLFSHMVEGFAYCKMIYDGEYPKDFRYLKVNEMFEKLTGLKDVEGKLVTEVIPGIRTSDDKLFESYSRVAKSGKAERFEIFVEALNDWYDISVYSLQNEYFVAVFDVVTKRKATEEALRESEIKFRSLFENAILGIYRTTPDGKIIDCNPALLKMLDFDSFEELAERNLELYGFEPGYSRTEFKRKIETEGEIIGLESSWKKKDGSSIIVRENAKAIRDNDGKFLFYEGTVEDITAKKEIEEKLVASEQKYRRLHESMMDGFVLINMDGLIIECNESYREMLGYTMEELKELTYIDLTPEKWHEFEMQLVKEKIKVNGYSDVYEKEYRKKDGTIFPIEIRTFLLKNDAGENEGMWAIVRDITERKKAEELIILSEEKFSKAFHSSPYAIILTRPSDGLILDINNGFTNITGYQYSEAIGKSTIDINIWNNIEDRKYVFDELSKGNKIYGKEFGFRKKSGEEAIALYSAEIISINNQDVLLSSFSDITGLKKAEEKIRSLVMRYHLILSNQFYGTLVVTEDNKVEFVNNKFCEMFSLKETPSELIGLSAEEMISKIINAYKDPETVLSLIKDVVGKDKLDFDNEIEMKDGRILLVDYNPIIINGKNTGRIWQHRDITDRKKLENLIRESEEKFKQVFENSLIGKSITGLDGSLNVNRAFCDMLGYTKEEISNHKFTDFTHPDDLQFTNDIVKSCIEGKRDSAQFEKRYIHKDSSTVWTYVSTVLQRDANGKPLFFITSILDLTERKKAEFALSESENKFRTLFESMNEGVALHELVFDESGKPVDYKIIEVNSAFEKQTGYSSELARNKIASEFYGVKTPPPYFDVYSKVALTGIPCFFDSYFPPLKKHFEISVFSPTKNWFATVFTDVTERKQADIALRESERKLREAQEMTHLGYWNWDIKTGDVEWSDEVYKIFRLNPNEYKPQIDSIMSLSPWPEDNQRDKELINRAIESHESGSYEQKFLRPDGSIGYYSSTFQGKYNEKGELTSIVGAVLDITERKIYEEKIKKLNEELELRVIERTAQLEQSNKELESFSYSVSHDLRAPLRSIDGFSLAIYDDYFNSLDAKGKEYIERIRNATSRMDELIDSLLKLSRVTRYEIRFDKFDLSLIAKEISENLKAQDIRRDAEIIIQDGVIVEGDSYLLRILFENLFANAWKFTNKKEKTIIEFGTIFNNENTIYFVRDNGAGFDMKYYDKLFGAFQRLHSKKDFPGTGIGLATAQRIVHRHNGKIWAESKINSETTFFFTLK